MIILDNKAAGNRNSIDPVSLGVHHLQSWNIVLPENGETLIDYGSEACYARNGCYASPRSWRRDKQGGLTKECLNVLGMGADAFYTV